MYEEDVANPVDSRPHTSGSEHSSVLRYVLLAVALLYVLASLYFMYTLKGRLDALDEKQQALESAQSDLSARLHSTKSEFKEALTSEVGLTKQEMAKRAAELERQQKASEANLKAAQSQQGQQIAAVSGEVSGVKSEVGAAKTEIVKTQTDIQATNPNWSARLGIWVCRAG